MRGSLTPALALAFLSGAAALAHQILWTRRLVDVLGASADTFSKVIGAFFVGLALGAWLASRATGARGSFWQRVAFAELAVAGLALPMLASASLGGWVYEHAKLGGWLKLLLPLALVTPPAAAMGLAVPWMIRALSSAAEFQSRHAVWLYAVNTLGGVAGLMGALLVALPGFGLNGASVCAIALNLLVPVWAFLLSQGRRKAVHDSASISQSGAGSSLGFGSPKFRFHVLAFASGFLVLMLEVVLQHQLAQITINSLFSSALVLVLVLLALAAAAWLAPWLVRWAGDSRLALRISLVVAALLCAAQPFLLTGMRDGLDILPYELEPLPYVGEVLELGLFSICPMLLAGGLIFPLLLRRTVEDSDGESPGRVAVLFAWNGVGGWLGAEFGQSVIAPSFGLWQSVVLAGAGYAVLLFHDFRISIYASPATSLVNRKPRIVNGSILVAVLAVVIIAFWFSRSLPQATVLSKERLAALTVGREGVVATLECGPGDWRMLFNNSYTLGGSKAQFNQERQSLLPLLLHGNPRTVATLGVATGSSVAGAALHPDVERINGIELSPLVLRYAREYFGTYNRQVFEDHRVTFIAEDARWVIAARPGSYDVVVGDLFLPWRTGEGRLFTLEHFQNVRRSLKPGGVFCQWLPLFQLTRPQFETIARTFQQVFPEAFLLRGDFYSELPILGLVGGRDLSQIDWANLETQCARLRSAGKATDPLVRHAEGVAMMVLGPLPESPPGPINTLGNAWLEWDAGQNILGLRTPWFIGVPCAEYVRDAHRAGQSAIPERLRSAHDAGQFCLTLEIASKLDSQALPQLREQINAHLPEVLRLDAGADWRQWPTRVKPAFNSAPIAP
jgi:spermidine synthase